MDRTPSPRLAKFLIAGSTSAFALGAFAGDFPEPRRLPDVGDETAIESLAVPPAIELVAHDRNSRSFVDANGMPIMRRIPPVEHEDGWIVPMRALPPVESGGPTTVGQREYPRAFRRLPDLSEEAAPPQTQLGDGYANRWVESGDALDSVAEQARTAIQSAYSLAEKGALYSARAEFIEAIRTISQGLDTYYGGTVHTDSLVDAIRALKEADDFSAKGDRLEVGLDVASLAVSHRTHVLTTAETAQFSNVAAMQRYYAFAQDRLVAATGGSEVGAEANYGLGKVYMELGRQSSTDERMHGPKAIVFLGAALVANPQHSLAANELGVLYARFGKLPEARRVLQQSVAAQSMPESWRNLALVHERLGEPQLAEQARMREQQAIAMSNTSVSELLVDSVRWVDPRAFASQNPQSPAPQASQPVRPTPNSVRTATRKSPFIWPW